LAPTVRHGVVGEAVADRVEAMPSLPRVNTSVPVHTAKRTRPGAGLLAIRRQVPAAGSKAAPSDSALVLVDDQTTDDDDFLAGPYRFRFPRVASGPDSATVQVPTCFGPCGFGAVVGQSSSWLGWWSTPARSRWAFRSSSLPLGQPCSSFPLGELSSGAHSAVRPIRP